MPAPYSQNSAKNRTDNRPDKRNEDQSMSDSRSYRTGGRRDDDFGRETQSDRTFEPSRYRDDNSDPYAGLRAGADHGGFGRETDFGGFRRGDDFVYGGPYGRGADNSGVAGEHFRTSPGFIGRGPKGYRRSDERIRDDVCERLTHHPHVDASEIEVTVTDGVVNLSGTVTDRRQKRFAEIAIEAMPGVLDVRNLINLADSSNSATPKA